MKKPITTITLSPALHLASERARAARNAQEEYHRYLERCQVDPQNWKPSREQTEHMMALITAVCATRDEVLRLVRLEIFPALLGAGGGTSPW